jgi:hypothetical protein
MPYWGLRVVRGIISLRFPVLNGRFGEALRLVLVGIVRI